MCIRDRGKVVVMADYGAFIEIAPGVEGLIHVSEMSWSQHLRSAQDFSRILNLLTYLFFDILRGRASVGSQDDEHWNINVGNQLKRG